LIAAGSRSHIFIIDLWERLPAARNPPPDIVSTAAAVCKYAFDPLTVGIKCGILLEPALDYITWRDTVITITSNHKDEI